MNAYSASVPVSRELLEDHSSDIVTFLAQSLRRIGAPWEFPDRNPMPEFVPFPRMATVEAIVTGWRADGWRNRLRDVLDVALNGLPDDDEWQ